MYHGKKNEKYQYQYGNTRWRHRAEENNPIIFYTTYIKAEKHTLADFINKIILLD